MRRRSIDAMAIPQALEYIRILRRDGPGPFDRRSPLPQISELVRHGKDLGLEFSEDELRQAYRFDNGLRWLQFTLAERATTEHRPDASA